MYIHTIKRPTKRTPAPRLDRVSNYCQIIAKLAALGCNYCHLVAKRLVVFKRSPAWTVTSLLPKRGFESLPLRHLRGE